MFQNLKNKIVNYFIEREIRRSDRKKVGTNISMAKSVGIVFSLENEEYYEFVCEIIEELSIKKKMVNALAFCPTKQLPNYFIPKLKIDVFTSKNLNWFEIPVSGFIKDFINKKYDLLIDLTITDHLALDYIASVSLAGFKAGRFRDKMVKHFDVLINKNEEMSDEAYFKYFMEYLTKINTNI